jgi:hypothetical protein
MGRVRAIAVIATCACFAASCGRGADETPALAVRPVAAAPVSGETVPHGDHHPRFGGLVLMNGDTHFEVVIDKGGNCRVYFTDAVRAELPASIASEVTVDLAIGDAPRQTFTLKMDEGARTWDGRIRVSDDPQAVLRVTYVGPDGPYWIDVPLSAWPDFR